MLYVTMNPGHPLVKKHIRAGGQAFVLEEGMNGHMITIYDNEVHTPLLWTHLIPATIEGRAMHNVQNAMFAAALAYNMDVEPGRHPSRIADVRLDVLPGAGSHEHLRRASVQGHPRLRAQPGRSQARCATSSTDSTSKAESIVVLSAPGDRRDEDIRDIAEIAAGHFDHYICRRDDNPRGRGPDEVAVMLKNKLLECEVESGAIEVVPDEQEATEQALQMASPGDLVLVLGDNIKRAWKQIIYFNSEARGEDGAEKTTTTISLPTTGEFQFDDGSRDHQRRAWRANRS